MKPIQSLLATVLALGFVGTQVAACTDVGESDGGNGGGGGGTSSSSAGNEGCGATFCGCWEDVTAAFTAKVQDQSTMMPLTGIELVCMGETMPITTSDVNGNLSFSIATKQSPGCGYERCNNLKLHDPTGMRPDVEGTFESLLGTTISM
jgi:hypothetical protein